jgi:hypothetical protein
MLQRSFIAKRKIPLCVNPFDCSSKESEHVAPSSDRPRAVARRLHTALASESNKDKCFLNKLLGTRAALPAVADALALMLADATDSECWEEACCAGGGRVAEDDGRGIAYDDKRERGACC